ncbi:hypothetical protein BN8_00548 [Fibrisoma limi BUZ 3]|uniref:Uncharacterized protein n=1 Tax=Fibrisoma limi BUZ 3 TaxID=1185876 RepID=I2GCI5_9BACT|nr:lipopolysaccharide biosynthesis protein [Fibrisoma limi]CCH51609.1 hypothetical protein BN8_00548 [Fibrisoma limi BUZ 3]
MAANAVGQATTLLIQLISVPLLLHYWGAAYYGEWLLLFTVPSYLTLSDVGLVAAVSNELAVSAAQQAYRRTIVLLSSGLVAVGYLSLLSTTGLYTLLSAVPYQQWLRIRLITEEESAWTLIALMLYVVLCLQQELLSGVYRAEGRYATGRLWITATRLVEFLIMALLVLLGGEAHRVAIAYALVRGVSLLGMSVDCRRRFSWVKQIHPRYVEWPVIRELVSPSVSFLVFALANAAVLQGSILLIGALLTPVHVVVYNTLRTLNNAIRQLVGVVTFSIWPEFTLAISQGYTHTAIDLHRRACQLTLWLAVGAIAGLELMGGPILHYWTQGAVQAEQPLFTFMLLATLLYTCWNTSATTLIAVNRHQSIALSFLIGSLGALGLGAVLMPHWGLVGLAAGFVVADAILVWVVLRQSLRLLEGERMKELFQSIITDFGWIRQVKQLHRPTNSVAKEMEP